MPSTTLRIIDEKISRCAGEYVSCFYRIFSLRDRAGKRLDLQKIFGREFVRGFYTRVSESAFVYTYSRGGAYTFDKNTRARAVRQWGDE